MEIELFGKKYVVEFAHDPVDKWTTASLHEVIEGKVSPDAFEVGVAFCNVKDVFSRKVGRKVAFADLLDKTERRLYRQQMWDLYFENLPNDRSK